jgi:peptide subunit release factor 1 (eRF1)
MTPTALEESSPATVDEHLSRLIAFEATTLPVISLYLNTQADKTGKPQFESFLRKEFANWARTWPASSPERQSFEKDMERIQQYLDIELKPSAKGVAIFACYGCGEFFEAVQLKAPMDENRLYVYNQPHLYHLVRLDDEFPRYAALVTDANSARIFVFGLGGTLDTEQVQGKKVQRAKVGGWSQARYQRRVENADKDHAKEVIEALARIVREESVSFVVLAGDPQIVPMLQEQMPKEIADKVIDIVKIDSKAREHEVLEKTLEAMRQQDAKTDAEKVEQLYSEYRARGLAVTGPEDTLTALANGQVDELLISATLEKTRDGEEPVEAILAPEIPDSQGGTDSDEPRQVLLADLLVTKAKQTDARVSFIEDPELLARVDGVGAFLRWR